MNNEELTKLQLQKNEFIAADALAKAIKLHGQVAVVDDDYPRVRFEYEPALAIFIEAMVVNGRFKCAPAEINRYRVYDTETVAAKIKAVKDSVVAFERKMNGWKS